MGKKKIVKKTAEEVLKEQESFSARQAKAQTRESLKKLTKGKVYIHSSYNNTVVTLTDDLGNVIAWSSAGAVGFKGPKKATPYAASKVVEGLMGKVRKTGLKKLEVFVRGIGSGRESAIRALAAAGMQLVSIKDVTPLPHNGPRPRKKRRA